MQHSLIKMSQFPSNLNHQNQKSQIYSIQNHQR
nr:MAG TPA: hypothetical protein [Caudoviricetes sp.]